MRCELLPPITNITLQSHPHRPHRMSLTRNTPSLPSMIPTARANHGRHWASRPVLTHTVAAEYNAYASISAVAVSSTTQASHFSLL